MLQVYVVCVCSVPVNPSCDLIRVKSYSELSEARIQTALVDINRYAKVVVRIARALQVEVDLVDRESEVCGVDSDKDLSAVLDESY